MLYKFRNDDDDDNYDDHDISWSMLKNFCIYNVSETDVAGRSRSVVK